MRRCCTCKSTRRVARPGQPRHARSGREPLGKEIARHRGAAAAHFADVTTPAGWSFDDQCTKFVTMLSPGVLNTRDKWWLRARLWKMILSQSAADGSWDATSSVAFALQARCVAEVADIKETWLERVKDRLMNLGELAEDLADAHKAGGVENVFAGRGATQTFDAAAAQPEAGSRQLARSASMLPASAAPPRVCDDPLLCVAADVSAAMPRRLDALRGAGVAADRVWATLACVAYLQTLNVCWLATDGDLYPATEQTIVDAGLGWLDAHAAEHPALAAALADGALEKAARRAVVQWQRAWERRVGELRRAEAIRQTFMLSHAHRTSTEVLRALCTKHGTMRVFLSAPLDGLQRWQMWTLLLSVVLNQLLVNIWMFYARGVNCCAEVMAILECVPGAPCRGREGIMCGDLAATFADEPLPPHFPDGLADYSCRQFPDEENPRDSLIVALISLAVALPVTFFIASCFSIANDNEAPESWLSWAGLPKLFCGPRAHRRWYYTGPDGQPGSFVRWWIRSRDAPAPETLINLYHSAVAWATGSKPPWTVEAEEAAEQEAEAEAGAGKPAQEEAGSDDLDAHSVQDSLASARQLRASKRLLTIIGVGGVYVVWAVFAWFIFTYGMLVYRNLGPEVQSQFANSFGVSYGVGAAAEFQDIAKELAKGLLILLLLERFYLTRPAAWLEHHVDYLSCQPLFFSHSGLSWLQQARLLYTYKRRIEEY